MLFRKKHPRSCSYCSFATTLADGSILCAKKGMTSPEKACLKFRYDPIRRIPGKQKAPDFTKYDENDFSL
ncbi:MAG: hypothetical protein IJB02_01390 [Oscillospiraceae bacterium]|nr:hypothetical protein [Oscillospiraceae bacterium]